MVIPKKIASGGDPSQARVGSSRKGQDPPPSPHPIRSPPPKPHTIEGNAPKNNPDVATHNYNFYYRNHTESSELVQFLFQFDKYWWNVTNIGLISTWYHIGTPYKYIGNNTDEGAVYAFMTQGGTVIADKNWLQMTLNVMTLLGILLPLAEIHFWLRFQAKMSGRDLHMHSSLQETDCGIK